MRNNITDRPELINTKEKFVNGICSKARKYGLMTNGDKFYKTALNSMYDRKIIGSRELKIIYYLIGFLVSKNKYSNNGV